MCDGGDGGDIICADDGDGIDGSGGCSLKGCLANVFIFLPLTVILLCPKSAWLFLSGCRIYECSAKSQSPKTLEHGSLVFATR